MAELLVRTPGQPDRVVALEKRSAVVGRGEDCEVRILEIRASRRHARLDRLPGSRGWALSDLGSSNGTFVGADRVLRRGLLHGDVVRIGETTLELRDAEAATPVTPAAPSAAPVPVVSGRLLVDMTAPSPSPAPSPPPAAPRPAPAPRRRPGEAAAATRRTIAFVGVGIAALLAVEVLLPGIAEGRRRKVREADDYTHLLATADLSYEAFEQDTRRFASLYPDSTRLADLESYLGERRVQNDRQRAAEDELDRLHRRGDSMPASEAFARLTALRRDHPDFPVVVRRAELALADLARRSDAAVARDVDAALADVDRAIARSDPASALRALAAVRARHARLPASERARVDPKEEAVLAEAKRLADEAVERAKTILDLDARREALGAALRGLAGTFEEERVLLALRPGVPGSPSAASKPPASDAPTPAATPPAPTITPEVVARASEAERLAKARAWARAAETYAALGSATAPDRLKREWSERAGEPRRIASLVADLGAAAAAAGDRPLRVKLDEGAVDVLAASAESARLRHKDETRDRAWSDLSPPDVLALLARPRPTPDQRIALALVAADLGDRATATASLLPLVELESHRELAFRVVARRLEGREEVPPGGYAVDGKDLVDRAELDRRVEARRVAALEAEAATIVSRLAGEPAFKKLDALRAKRDELDRRRARALLAIFNEKHYPYPKEPPGPYNVVQAEIDERIEAVEEVWNDPVTAHPGKVPEVRTLLARHSQVLGALRTAGRDTAPFEEAVRPYRLHSTADPLTVQTYFRDEEERDRLEYNRWVMTQHNPLQTAVATEPEREQVRITNEYRVMMGFSFSVTPGGASIEAVDGTSVVSILDQAQQNGRVALHAVRIDDRLVRSARGHSEDMARRGFFAHSAPPDPEKGLPGTTPFDRMSRAGYAGGGAGENIAQGQGDPMGAHLAWRHSSGHHRNMLSPWLDLGSGQSGSLWTQNFASGGGGEPVIPGRHVETTPVEEPPLEPAPEEPAPEEGEGTPEDAPPKDAPPKEEPGGEAPPPR